MRIRSVILAAALAGGACATAAAQVSMADMMKHTVDPAAQAFWAAGNDPPEGETPEQAEKRWQAAQSSIAVLKAAAAEMQKPPYVRAGGWAEHAKLMGDVAEKAAPAMAARDMEGAFAAGGALYETCEACHKTYVPRGE